MINYSTGLLPDFWNPPFEPARCVKSSVGEGKNEPGLADLKSVMTPLNKRPACEGHSQDQDELSCSPLGSQTGLIQLLFSSVIHMAWGFSCPRGALYLCTC